MFEPLLNEEERGQVGIGTLIVFIAMVLVAAIAAGVLINTAGFLQTQAEATGEESTEQVSNSLQVDSVVSEVESGELRAIAIDVSLAPGSDPIDITSATLEYIGDSSSGTYPIGSGDPSTLSDINGANGIMADSANFDTTLSDESDTARIYLIATVGSGEAIQALDVSVASADSTTTDISGLPLAGGAEAQVTITAPGGGETTAAIQVPDVLVNGEGVRL
jgi:flagellin FlaB